MRQVEKILGECLDCGICLQECLYLEKVGKSPIELANGFKEGTLSNKPKIAYSCFLCDLCASLCPQELNIGAMCMEVRETMVEDRTGPLKSHGFMKKDQEFVNSESFLLTQFNPQYSHAATIPESCAYFPGCALSGYSPQLVIDSYEYLKSVLRCSAIILHCCGAPSLFIGRRAEFEMTMAHIVEQVKKVGAGKLVMACPDCYHTTKRFMKNYDSSLEVTTIYHIMASRGLPALLPEVENSVITVHDSCKARNDAELQNAVRDVIRKLGHTIDEMSCSREKTRCCGNGGMVPYVDQQLYKGQAETILAATTNNISTYCAGCRETLAAVGGSVAHVLDLVFNPNWRNAVSEKANTGKKKRENQALLKKLLEEKMGVSSC